MEFVGITKKGVKHVVLIDHLANSIFSGIRFFHNRHAREQLKWNWKKSYK